MLRDKKGVTLVELLVVMTIMVILSGIGFSMRSWQNKYKVEKETDILYTDILNAKVRAIQTNRIHFVFMSSNVVGGKTTYFYYVVDDTATAPDGDRTMFISGANADTKLFQRTISYPFSITSSAGVIARFEFTKDGMLMNQSWVSIRLVNTFKPDYDCIYLDLTRTRMGAWDTSTSTCVLK